MDGCVDRGADDGFEDCLFMFGEEEEVEEDDDGSVDPEEVWLLSLCGGLSNDTVARGSRFTEDTADGNEVGSGCRDCG